MDSILRAAGVPPGERSAPGARTRFARGRPASAGRGAVSPRTLTALAAAARPQGLARPRGAARPAFHFVALRDRAAEGGR